jgi:vacuolar-type H+-ATPase subunit H
MARKGGTQTTAAGPGKDLAALVAAEQELEERLAKAREEARARVEAARQQAETLRLELEQDLTRTRERVAAEAEAEQERLVSEVLVAGERDAARLDAVPDPRIEELAAIVVDGLLARGGQ